MQLASVLTPMSPTNLRLAAQCGVEGVVVRYPGTREEDLRDAKQLPNQYGLEVFAVEGYLPIERIKLGTDEGDRDLGLIKSLLQQMERLQIPLLCYNFMAGTDWVRTRLDAPERGGAKVTAFDLRDAEQAISLSPTAQLTAERINAEALWRNLDRFLNEVLPVAEATGITLAMHPDDPPLAEFMGRARIMNSVEGIEKLLAISASPQNGVCFCQGTFATMGVDIPQTIRRLGQQIRYVHFRDVRGTAESFAETFHDNGPTDMAAAIAALKEVGFAGPIRPDHVPQLEGEDDGEPGYTMLGRLFAYGYIRGLIDATKP